MPAEPAMVSDFVAKQCEFLRSRLSSNIDETAALERHSVSLTGAMWAWMATHHPQPSGLLPWLPLLLTAFLGLRAIVVYARILSIRLYLARVEEAASVPSDLRWFAAHEQAGGRWRPATAIAWWGGLTVVNVVFGLAAARPGW